MNIQSNLKEILREIFKYNNSQSQFSQNGQISDALIKLAISKLISMRMRTNEADAIMTFLESKQDINQLKIDFDSINPQQTKIIKEIYEFKSVVLSWNHCLRYILINNTIQKPQIISILSNLLKLGQNNQTYKDQSQRLYKRYFQPFIETFKTKSCQRCVANYTDFNEDKNEINKINRNFAKQLQAKTNECTKIWQQLQKYKRTIQILSQRVKKLDQIEKKKNQSVIFAQQQQFQQYQYDKIQKQISQQFQLPLQQIQKRPLLICKEFQDKIYPMLKKQFSIVRLIQLSFKFIKNTQQKSIETNQYDFSQTQTQTDKINVNMIQVQTNFIETKQSQIQTQAISYQQIFHERILMLNENTRKQKLFSGQVFGQQDTYRVRLVDQIQSKGKYRIKSTHLLYRYDPLNKQNFHRYIDNVQGLAFVVKTLKGVYLCGYYSGKLVPNQILNQFGLIINLNKDQSYEIKQEPHSNRVIKAMIYDDFYCIFGNAELRIKSWENHIFSNFGIMGAYFNNKGKKVNDFLGEENERQAFFYTYQFFQVVLDKQSEK